MEKNEIGIGAMTEQDIAVLQEFKELCDNTEDAFGLIPESSTIEEAKELAYRGQETVDDIKARIGGVLEVISKLI